MDFKYIVVLKSLESESSEKEEFEFYFKPQVERFKGEKKTKKEKLV